MSLKLIPPRGERTNFTVRGTINGIRIERSARTGKAEEAKKELKRIQKEFEAKPPTISNDERFATAATAYMKDNGDARFMTPILKEIGTTPIRDLDQRTLDKAAEKLYPHAEASTRNRQFYTPVIAVLRHAGLHVTIRRPKGGNGAARTEWLWPDQFAKLHAAATKIDQELGLLFLYLVSTGARLSEALNLQCSDVKLDESFAFCGETKNGDPRSMHLPPAVVEAMKQHPRGLERKGKVFRWVKSGRLYSLARSAYEAAEIDDGDAPFHILRHTFGSWMRRYAGADDRNLLDTGAWRNAQSVRRYTHTIVTESARMANALPLPSVPNPSPLHADSTADSGPATT